MYKTIITLLCVIFMGLTDKVDASTEEDLASENFALMVMVPKVVGDAFYDELGKPHFKRALWEGDDYHVTVGFVENVSGLDKAAFKLHFDSFLKDKIGEGLNFKALDVGLVKRVFFSLESIEPNSAALFAPGSTPYIAMVPEDTKPFEDLNKLLHTELESYLDGKYKLNEFTSPDNFVPHITLGARAGAGAEVSAEEVSETLTSLQFLKGRELTLNTILVS